MKDFLFQLSAEKKPRGYFSDFTSKTERKSCQCESVWTSAMTAAHSLLGKQDVDVGEDDEDDENNEEVDYH